MRKASPQKNTLLKNAQGNAASIFFKRVFFSATQERIFSSHLFFIFFSPPQVLSHKPNMPVSNVNRFTDRFVQTFNLTLLRSDRRASGNSTYPKGGVSCFADTFVQGESSVLLMKFCGKSPALRVAAKR